MPLSALARKVKTMATLTGKTITSTTGKMIKKVQARSTGGATVELDDDTVVRVVEGAGKIMKGDYVLVDGSHRTIAEINIAYTIS